MPSGVNVGEQLRRVREDAGVSLARMAAQSHFSTGYLCNIEKGRRPASPEIISAYRSMLGDTLHRRALLAVLADVGSPVGRVGQILAASVTDSLRLLAAPEREDVDDLHARPRSCPSTTSASRPGRC